MWTKKSNILRTSFKYDPLSYSNCDEHGAFSLPSWESHSPPTPPPLQVSCNTNGPFTNISSRDSASSHCWLYEPSLVAEQIIPRVLASLLTFQKFCSKSAFLVLRFGQKPTKYTHRLRESWLLAPLAAGGNFIQPSPMPLFAMSVYTDFRDI